MAARLETAETHGGRVAQAHPGGVPRVGTRWDAGVYCSHGIR